MDVRRAKEIIKSLADGFDPQTGDPLPNADSCNQQDVVEALYVAVETLDYRMNRRILNGKIQMTTMKNN